MENKFENAEDQAADYLVTQDGEKRADDAVDQLAQETPETPEDVNEAFKAEGKPLTGEVNDPGGDV